MLRVLKLAAIIYVCSVMFPSIAARTLLVNGRQQNQISSSDNAPPFSTIELKPSATMNSADEVIDAEEEQQAERYYHPAEDKKPHVIEEFNRQYLDGSYEYKYVLSNGVTRYEKSYWKPVGKGKKILARKGFYSHPLTNHKYLTVFYTADEHGYQQDTAKFTKAVPTLPKHLDVPQLEVPHKASTIITKTTTTATTTRSTTQKPKITSVQPKVTTTTERPLIIKPSEFNWIY